MKWKLFKWKFGQIELIQYFDIKCIFIKAKHIVLCSMVLVWLFFFFFAQLLPYLQASIESWHFNPRLNTPKQHVYALPGSNNTPNFFTKSLPQALEANLVIRVILHLENTFIHRNQHYIFTLQQPETDSEICSWFLSPNSIMSAV